tara:strand:+ start:111488 stop:112396 length:909 start_codon:yes stop_codon:yes gene_type:complete
MNLPDTPSKILIVDDEPLNIEVLSETLEDMGDISFATDGDTALKLAAEIRPDIILLDVMMPGMDGYEVCRRLKESPETKNIPVIFVTALADEADEAKGIKIGAIDYVTKPVNATIVIARTRNHLELKRYRDYLTEIAFVDGLTEIANRRRFDEHIEMEWQRARRSSDWLSVVLLDIDHFKQFNDTYGHQAGDDCLRKVAAALKKVAHRPADLIARYGGEEFVGVLPQTDADGAEALGNALREAVSALNIPHKDSSAAGHVTISVGAASIEVPKDGEYSALVKAADNNLYKAKEGGRNRVVAS